MNKLILIGLSLLIGTTSSVARDDDYGRLNRYDAANKELLASGLPAPKVVFIGNSITDNWGAWRKPFFSDNNFVGRGISGQTSYNFVIRFRPDVVNLKPEAVVINVGTNDVAENTDPYNEDRTMGNIMSMVDIARANGIKVILSTVLPAAGFGWNKAITDAPAKISALNARIASYAADNDLGFIDYFTPLVADDGVSLNPAYTNDGVHPTEAGYEIMEKIALDTINNYLK